MPAPLAIPTDPQHWLRVLQAAERLQRTLDGVYVVGGTAAALWVGHRTSHDADHYMPDLEHRFDEVLDRLEALPGWITARIRRPHLILGHLDGVMAGVAQFPTVASDSMQVETTQVTTPQGLTIRLPTFRDTLLLKNRLLMTRNMARDYVDYVYLAMSLEDTNLEQALAPARRYKLPSSGPWSHDGSERPIAFLEELGLRLVRPTPKDTRQIRLHWRRFQSLSTGGSFPSWDEIASHCQTEGTRVLEVHCAWNTREPYASGHRQEDSDDGEVPGDGTDGKNTCLNG